LRISHAFCLLRTLLELRVAVAPTAPSMPNALRPFGGHVGHQRVEAALSEVHVFGSNAVTYIMTANSVH
jgi:hypothetical protein